MVKVKVTRLLRLEEFGVELCRLRVGDNADERIYRSNKKCGLVRVEGSVIMYAGGITDDYRSIQQR